MLRLFKGIFVAHRRNSEWAGAVTTVMLVTLTASSLSHAQTSQRKFEVASLKVSELAGGGYLSGGPGSSDPTQFTFMHASMRSLLRRAFAVNSYQLATPAGLPGGFYDLRVKLPPDIAEAEFDEMLRNLLVDRFAMQYHRETRELKGYEMVAAKGGIRMKPAEKPAASSSSEMVGGGLSLIKDRSGEPELSPGRHGKLVIPLSDGRSRQSGRMQTITEIIEMCARELGQPVVDGTGLQGAYDYNIDFARSPDDPAEPKPDSETPFLTAFQGQLGLRLEPKKVPVSVVVIDHIEKKPAEN